MSGRRRPERSGSDRLVEPDLIVVVATSLLLIAPFLILHHVNTIDGPAHVLGGRLLGSLGDTSIVRHYYDISFNTAPNVSSQLLLVALMRVVSPTWRRKPSSRSRSWHSPSRSVTPSNQ